jgi:aspartyl-tRNA synthetase
MIKWASSIPKESVVDLYVTVTLPHSPVLSTTQKDVELNVQKLFVVSKALPELPFQIEDAARSDTLLNAEGSTYVAVGLDTRLNNRILDLRTPANQAIMRIQSGVGRLFREFLDSRGFVEIHTPKLIGGASESGSSCFTLKYFEDNACLAQSPQLYKQMACACSGLERVYEIGPVFRAENSNTHRHLCEFTGLDFEMVIQEHYHEVLDVFSDLFIYIFDNLKTRYAKELEIINEQVLFPLLSSLMVLFRLTCFIL